MKHNFNDGGRAEAGYRGQVADCAIRSICIAARLPYKSVYAAAAEWERTHPGDTNSVRHHLESLGWAWHPCGVGGAAVHLRAEELPFGRIIVALPGRPGELGHLIAVIDHEIHDTFDCSFLFSRGVEGYFTAPESSPPKAGPTEQQRFAHAVACLVEMLPNRGRAATVAIAMEKMISRRDARLRAGDAGDMILASTLFNIARRHVRLGASLAIPPHVLHAMEKNQPQESLPS
jgi:hypothetical protein